MLSDFNSSEYLRSIDLNDRSADLSYLYDISDHNFRQIFSIDVPLRSGKDQTSQEYDKHYKYIYAGCSETLGLYLSAADALEAANYQDVKRNIWGDIVGKSIGLIDSLNISSGGASVMGIANSLIRQIRLYGAPEHVFMLLPNLDSRVTFLSDPSRLISNNKNNDLLSEIGTIGEYETNYSKAPHLVEEVLTKRWTTYLNIQSLIALEAICSAEGINLIYSTWSTSTHKVLTSANSLAIDSGSSAPFKNYIPSNYRKSAGGCIDAAEAIPKDCHPNISDHPRWFIGLGDTHMGAHAHVHIADLFLAELLKRGFSFNL